MKLLLARDDLNLSAVDNDEDTPMKYEELGLIEDRNDTESDAEIIGMLQAAVEWRSSRQLVA